MESIAHMALPLGEAGIMRFQMNQRACAMQSSIGDKTGLYIFPVSRWQNATREEKSRR